MATACCGSSCSITTSEFADATALGHSFTIDITSNEIDVRAFGSGTYGDWIACAASGTIAFNSYVRPDVDINDAVTFAGNVCSESISFPAVVTSQSINVDAKGVVEFTTNLRMTGAGTIS